MLHSRCVAGSSGAETTSARPHAIRGPASPALCQPPSPVPVEASAIGCPVEQKAEPNHLFVHVPAQSPSSAVMPLKSRPISEPSNL